MSTLPTKPKFEPVNKYPLLILPLPELPSDPRLLPQVLQADADVPARARGGQGQPAAGARPGHAPPRHVHRLTPPQALRLQRRGSLRRTQGKLTKPRT